CDSRDASAPGDAVNGDQRADCADVPEWSSEGVKRRSGASWRVPLQRDALVLVTLVRYPLQKRIQLQRPLHSNVERNINARVRVFRVIIHDAMTARLRQRVSIREPTLLFITNAPVEILFTLGIAPEVLRRSGRRSFTSFAT